MLNRHKYLTVSIAIIMSFMDLFYFVGNVGASSGVCTPPSPSFGTDIMIVTIPVTTSYTLWTRIKAPSSTNNSMLLQVDSTNCFILGGGSTLPLNTWTWVNSASGITSPSNSITLTQGTHTIELIGNNPDIAIDNIELLSDPNCVPAVLGTNCTTITNPPVITITSPTALTSVHGVSSVTASVSDQSGTGLAKVDYLNSTLLLGTVMVTPYSYSWNTLSGSVPNTKSYPLSAKAFDNAGNTTTSAPVNVCVNNGDVNNDGLVNINDLSIMAQNWGLVGATYVQGNVASQSAVNITDLSVLAQNWAFSCI
jgi:hypothetical protein